MKALHALSAGLICCSLVVAITAWEDPVCKEDESGGSCSASSSLDWDDEGLLVTYGVKQHVSPPERTFVTPQVEAMTQYMMERTSGDENCVLKHSSCLLWAAHNECEANPNYMHVNCAPACRTCDTPHHERCPIPDNDVWQPGDLNRMFERIVSDTHVQEKYNVQVIRRPGMEVDGNSVGNYPWLIQLDDFISEEECNLLISQGTGIGYEPSTVFGGIGIDIQGSSSRTSSHTWCQNECYTTHALPVLNRIENLTGVPEANFEHLQLLKYDVGQYYKEHNDFIDHLATRPQGVRILTVFLYLNDVEAGGETNFPRLGVSVKPKRGRVVIWPSVLDEDPHKIDERTLHQAKPVEKGYKYGANAWLHQRDFQGPFEANCT